MKPLSRTELRARYMNLIGYDPFAEGWTEAEVRKILREPPYSELPEFEALTTEQAKAEGYEVVFEAVSVLRVRWSDRVGYAERMASGNFLVTVGNDDEGFASDDLEALARWLHSRVCIIS